MKKIISLIASVAMLATMVSSAFAASVENNAPVVESTVTEVSAEEYAGMMGSALEANQKAYMIVVNANGFDLESKPGTGFGGTSKRSGVLLSTIEYKLVFEDESKLVMAAGMDDGMAPAGTVGVFASASWNTAPTMYPVIANTDAAGKQVTATDNLYINTFLVVVSGEVKADIAGEFTVCPYTNNVAGASQVFRNDNNNISYTVNGEAATAITFGEEDEPIVPDEPKEMDIKVKDDKRFDLDVDGDKVADGYAWEVLVTNYDSTKTVSAKFTDDEGNTRAGKEKTEITGLAAAETDGSIEFVALLQLSQFRSVNLEIVVE